MLITYFFPNHCYTDSVLLLVELFRYGHFLPRDAMLARYILSSCVCLSVCPSVRPSVCHKTAAL